MVIPRTLLVAFSALALSACASLSAPKQDTEQWRADWKQRTARWADGAARGAQTVGSSLSTAAQGVAKGFDDPQAAAFGAYPKGYAETVRRHLVRFESVDPSARMTFAKPQRGYMNQGLFQGGGVAWQGWLVDVRIEIASRFEGQERIREYVVRMREGDVIEVHDARYSAALRRVDSNPPAAASDS